MWQLTQYFSAISHFTAAVWNKKEETKILPDTRLQQRKGGGEEGVGGLT